MIEKTSALLDILSTNSKIAKVVVNGEKWGPMLVEESLGKNFLENVLINFIGYTDTRVKVDYLRILIYLRFFDNYVKKKMSSERL